MFSEADRKAKEYARERDRREREPRVTEDLGVRDARKGETKR